MLTSFFSKSKPVNGVVVAVFMAIFFAIANFRDWFLDFQVLEFLEKPLVLIVYILSVYVLNFIARKNELTRRSAYKILFFAIFSTSFFELLQNSPVIFANFFILLALRRIISLRSKKIMQKKIFDATFWICIASLFYFWSILFLVVIYAGIFNYLPRIKNWLNTRVAVLCVWILTVTFHLIAYENVYGFREWFQPSEFNFSNYQELKILIPISFILALMIWTLGNFLKLIQKASISLRPSLNLVLLSLFTALALAVLAPTKNGSELIFLFAPLSIVASTYFEKKKDKIFKEVLLAILILMPLVLPFLY